MKVYFNNSCKICKAEIDLYKKEKIKEIADSIVKLIPTLIDKKIDLFSSKVNQNLNGI